MFKLNVASEKESCTSVSKEITGILRQAIEADVSNPQVVVECEVKIWICPVLMLFSKL